VCHLLKLGVAISGDHLDKRLPEDSARVARIILDEAACECAARVMASKVSHPCPLAYGDTAGFHIAGSATVSRGAQRA